MSTYQMAVRNAVTFQGVSVAGLRGRFWRWWIGLYADAPQKLPPMI